ncbi:hypothetical protein [Sphingobium subterraneum]|uniref:Uncharacterized protein n=1 Tax=Sphingobium subterraneum TaxID=627688 RepID=A0A841IUY3_9SPHN|nr:hypothetical protein [Sphingobium subterraneum]MBB6122487.1 hypothetical protein [Sphingobium subterraneum]
MPNKIAYAALLLWPIITIILFQAMPLRRALIWSLLGAYMFLPVRTGFDLPGLPNLDKSTIPNVCTLVCVVLFSREKYLRMPKSGTVVLLMAIFFISPLLTGFNNRDPIILSQSSIPGMTMYDSLSAMFTQACTLIPFILGYSLLSRSSDHQEVLRALVIAGLIYSLPTLWEVRFSPQLHVQLYGFFPHEFIQAIRSNGYRAIVFMGHGLLVSIFTCMCLLAAVGLWRQKVAIRRVPPPAVAGWLSFVLVMAKSSGAIMFGTIFAPMLLFMRARPLLTIMTGLALVLLTYPALRGTGIIPVKEILSATASVSQDRADSLGIRIYNEENLLAKANQRPFFGWGTWGRNQIYATGWTGDGQASITDGVWIIVVGQYGWVGYTACFGLLCGAFLIAYRARRTLGNAYATISLLMVLMVNLLDLIPNSSLNPFTWLLAGSLSGLSPHMIRRVRRQRAAPPGAPISESLQPGKIA